MDFKIFSAERTKYRVAVVVLMASLFAYGVWHVFHDRTLADWGSLEKSGGNILELIVSLGFTSYAAIGFYFQKPEGVRAVSFWMFFQMFRLELRLVLYGPTFAFPEAWWPIGLIFVLLILIGVGDLWLSPSKRPAIEQLRRTRSRTELVHYSARHADEVRFRRLSQFRDLQRLACPSQCQSQRHSQRRRRTQASAQRHLGIDQHVRPAQLDSSARQLPGDADDPVRPIAHRQRIRNIGDRPLRSTAQLFRINPQPRIVEKARPPPSTPDRWPSAAPARGCNRYARQSG